MKNIKEWTVDECLNITNDEMRKLPSSKLSKLATRIVDLETLLQHKDNKSDLEEKKFSSLLDKYCDVTSIQLEVLKAESKEYDEKMDRISEKLTELNKKYQPENYREIKGLRWLGFPVGLILIALGVFLYMLCNGLYWLFFNGIFDITIDDLQHFIYTFRQFGYKFNGMFAFLNPIYFGFGFVWCMAVSSSNINRRHKYGIYDKKKDAYDTAILVASAASTASSARNAKKYYGNMTSSKERRK